MTILLALGAVGSQTVFAQSSLSGPENVEPRIVAVGDIHGAHDAFVGLLRATRLIDGSQNWIGGDAQLVSLGDILDRGADSRKSMDLLMKLQGQSRQAGGRVHVVAGNHELMNVMGDLRYVAKGEYAAFAPDETGEMRSTAWKTLSAHRKISQAEFDNIFPKGYFAHRAAFAADGKYGQWLMSLPAIVVVGETAFVHGGLPESVAKNGADKTNVTYRDAVFDYMATRQKLLSDNVLPNDELQGLERLARARLKSPNLSTKDKRKLKLLLELEDAAILGREGPLWYRGAMRCRPVFEKPILTGSLQKIGAKRVVVGHTPNRKGKVLSKYNGALIQLDTGMLVSHYNGRPSALNIKGNDLSVQYLDPLQKAPLTPSTTSPTALSTPDILEALKQGSISKVQTDGERRPIQVTIAHKGNAYKGVFFEGVRDVAAFELDQILGFDLVPPSVKRTLNSKAGTLQIVFDDSLSENERTSENISIGGWCPIPRQVDLMKALDILTANTGRSGDNLFYRQKRGLIYLSDFASSFDRTKRLPKGIKGNSLVLSPGTRQALYTLDKSNLEKTMQGLLSSAEIDALLARRDAMLKKFK